MSELARERCEACREGARAVDEHEIAELMPQIPAWRLEMADGVPHLIREFRFRDFAGALAFANRVGEIAEAEGHHPAILVEYGRATVSWWTHRIRGLHRNDFIMAARTDDLLADRSAAAA